MKDYELPQCENCKWSLGIEQVRKSLVIGNKLFCDKCRPTKRAPDARKSGHKKYLQIKKVL